MIVHFGRMFCARVPASMKEGNVRLRPVRISDSAFLKTGFSRQEILLANGLPGAPSASGSAIRRWIKKTYNLAWCIEIDSRPAGFAGVFRLRPGESAEASLVVFEDALRRQGYGGRAWHMIAAKLAVQTGIRRLFVRVRADNPAAEAFWLKMGFEYAGCEDGISVMALDIRCPLKNRCRFGTRTVKMRT